MFSPISHEVTHLCAACLAGFIRDISFPVCSSCRRLFFADNALPGSTCRSAALLRLEAFVFCRFAPQLIVHSPRFSFTRCAARRCLSTHAAHHFPSIAGPWRFPIMHDTTIFARSLRSLRRVLKASARSARFASKYSLHFLQRIPCVAFPCAFAMMQKPFFLFRSRLFFRACQSCFRFS